MHRESLRRSFYCPLTTRPRRRPGDDLASEEATCASTVEDGQQLIGRRKGTAHHGPSEDACLWDFA
jgi:hypothetical protein